MLSGMIGTVILRNGCLCVQSSTLLGNDADRPIRYNVIYVGAYVGAESDYRYISGGGSIIGKQVECFSSPHDFCDNTFKWYHKDNWLQHILMTSSTPKKDLDGIFGYKVIEEEIPKPKTKLEVKWRQNISSNGDRYCWHKLTKKGWVVCK